MLTKQEKREMIEEIKKELLKNEITVYFEKVHDDVLLPSYANENDAGMDIRSDADVMIKPGETKVIPTGLKVAIPEGYELQVRPRSGISLKTPLRLSNSPGTIDSGYRGEIGILVTNTSLSGDEVYTLEETDNKMGIYQIHKNDRIAQIVLCKYEKIHFQKSEHEPIENIGKNRGGAFGHTGLK